MRQITRIFMAMLPAGLLAGGVAHAQGTEPRIWGMPGPLQMGSVSPPITDAIELTPSAADDGSAQYGPAGAIRGFEGGSNDQPVMLTADQMQYDQATGRVTAAGNVEIVQGGRILMARQVVYDQQTGQVTAEGDVSLMEANGDVFFADALALRDDMNQGVVREFRVRFADNSLFAAREARRVSEDVTELDQAVYSPCRICEVETPEAGEETPAPLWQIKADDVTIDQAEQEVSYRNVFFEVYGLPVFYTPWFSHATPDADAKSGLLAPEYRDDSLLGTVVEMPVYLTFAPNSDLTLMPTYIGDEAPLLGGEYRHLYENGFMRLRGSGTFPDDRDDSGARLEDNAFRGHIDGFGNFRLSEDWSWGFLAQRATDDTYMRRYRISDTDILTSRLFVEGLDWVEQPILGSRGRSYALVEGLAYQGLAIGDDPSTTPYALPNAQWWWQSLPGWAGGKLTLDSSATALARDEGAQSRRVSQAMSYEIPYIMPNGMTWEVAGHLRADLYQVEDYAAPGSGADFSGTVARAIPEIETTWSWPFMRPLENGGSLTLEPIAQAIYTPEGVNSGNIPNEDSRALEFNDTNLFERNHYPGYDLVETGARLNYGVRGQWDWAAERYLSFLLGQHLQSNAGNVYPFSNDLTENQSDFVGRLGVHYDWLDAVYRFRLDDDSFNAVRNEVNAWVDLLPFTLYLDYIGLDNDPYLQDRQELFASAGYALTENWTLNLYGRRDLQNDQNINAGSGLTFSNECLTVWTQFNREYTRDRDIAPATSFSIRASLKNLE